MNAAGNGYNTDNAVGFCCIQLHIFYIYIDYSYRDQQRRKWL